MFALCSALAAAMMTARDAQSADAKPTFLVATRDLQDPLFQQSVILMLPQTEFPLVAGLIINKPTTVPVRELFSHVSPLKKQSETAYFGGPVGEDEPALLVRGSSPGADAIQLFDDVYLTAAPRAIAGILKNAGSTKDLRLFLGRAQWTRDQLHGEILEGSWYTMPADTEFVFSQDPRAVWRALVERGQLLEVDEPRLREPGVLGLICCTDALASPAPRTAFSQLISR